jgi:ankyrin repeat protein
VTVDEQLIDAAEKGNVTSLAALLDASPEKLRLRAEPYAWSLLHFAARHGHLDAVDLLLKRGLDPNTREVGDNTYAMHWAAAHGHPDVVQRLADAGGDVIGDGDDHQLQVIGWATCWEGCDDAAHRQVAEILLARGARHHIFSAIALDLPGELRRIVAADPAALERRMSRNENHQLPLHFAVRMRRPEMAALLLDLGADPRGVDGGGMPAAGYATAPDSDRPVMTRLRKLALAELADAEREHRRARGGMLDLMALVSLADWENAGPLIAANRPLIENGGPEGGALHLLAKRGDARAVKWLLEQGANPNARWPHWDADVTPLHLAAAWGTAEIVALLLDAGADPAIRDSKHNGDALGWAQHFQREESAALLRGRGATH